jgi:hypothetical protein
MQVNFYLIRSPVVGEMKVEMKIVTGKSGIYADKPDIPAINVSDIFCEEQSGLIILVSIWRQSLLNKSVR